MEAELIDIDDKDKITWARHKLVQIYRLLTIPDDVEIAAARNLSRQALCILSSKNGDRP